MTDDAAPGPPASLRVPVDPAIEHAGQTYDELLLREPTVAEVEALDAYKGVTWTVKLVAAVATVPEKVVQKLGIRTLNTCSAYLTDFTAAGLPTATNS